jgi:phosphotransferase system  glucose/maltose/N-acetylglucosamine-specific IIC component
LNWQQELKNYGLFLAVGLPLLVPVLFLWSAITEAAGYIALGLMVVYPIVSLFRWVKERVRA